MRKGRALSVRGICVGEGWRATPKVGEALAGSAQDSRAANTQEVAQQRRGGLLLRMSAVVGMLVARVSDRLN